VAPLPSNLHATARQRVRESELRAEDSVSTDGGEIMGVLPGPSKAESEPIIA
jgi:hypothetical protein